MNDLAKKIKDGDEAAFSRFFHQTHYQVVRYLHNLLDHDGHAKDIAQEVYIKVWQNRLQINPGQSLKAWLFTIVRNTAITHIRKLLSEKKQKTVLSQDFSFNSTANNAGEDTLESTDARSIFADATKLVPPQFVRCLVLHRQEGLTYRQIAEREGISIKTVEKRISVTLSHLRKACQVNESLVITLFLSGVPYFVVLT